MRALRLLLVASGCSLRGAEGDAVDAAGDHIYLTGSTPQGLRADWLGWYDVHTGPLPPHLPSKQRESKLVDGRHVYAKRGERAKLMWFNKHSGRWYAGKARAVGHAAGVLHVPDMAMAPDKISARWQVWQGPKVGWVVASDLRVLDDAQGRALVDAEAKALGEAADTIRLVGSTPSDLRHEWLGVYVRRPDALIAGRPSYVARSDVDRLLWYVAETAAWYVGTQASLGKPKGVMLAYDVAVRPDRIAKGAWMLGQGLGKGWVSAPELRWLQGVEADAAAAAQATRLHASERTVYLLDGNQLSGGQVRPVNTAPAWQGAYVADLSWTDEGRTRYIKPQDADGKGGPWLLWYNTPAGMWLVGRQGRRREPNTTKPTISVYDGAQLPHEIRGTWREWLRGDASHPIAVRCLVGAVPAALLREQAAAGTRALTQSAATVQLVGLRNGPRHEWMGAYTRRAGPLVHGRHSFAHVADDKKALWYDARSTSWRVGERDSAGPQEGRFYPNRAVLRVSDPALSPESTAAPWQLRQEGGSETWGDSGGVRCIAGNDALVEEQAQTRELARAELTVYLAGVAPPAVPSKCMGAYDMVDAANPSRTPGTRRAYRRRDDASLTLRYDTRSGEWRLERSLDTPGGGGSATLILSAYDGALLPERVAVGWKTASGRDASHVKCLGGVEGRLAFEADGAVGKLQSVLTPGYPAWMFPVRKESVIEQVRLVLRSGVQPWRIHLVLTDARTRDVPDSILRAAARILPMAPPPSPPPPSPPPPPNPISSPPPPPPSLSPPPPPPPLVVAPMVVAPWSTPASSSSSSTSAALQTVPGSRSPVPQSAPETTMQASASGKPEGRHRGRSKRQTQPWRQKAMPAEDDDDDAGAPPGKRMERKRRKQQKHLRSSSQQRDGGSRKAAKGDEEKEVRRSRKKQSIIAQGRKSQVDTEPSGGGDPRSYNRDRKAIKAIKKSINARVKPSKAAMRKSKAKAMQADGTQKKLRVRNRDQRAGKRSASKPKGRGKHDSSAADD